MRVLGADSQLSGRFAISVAEIGRRVGPLSLALSLMAGAASAQDDLQLPVFQPLPNAVSPFVLNSADGSHARALHCLTQAVYYEAATEPREGQEAVAQVVLNRMKHPAFPKSVCGVVFEGSNRSTGCQFTFTCDGSLNRAPVAGRWDAAEQVAAAALAGHVSDLAGASTHYHAAWMTPYWASSLVETGRIGSQIFYRRPDATPQTLTATYSGAEPAVAAGLAAAPVGRLTRVSMRTHGRHPSAASTANGVAQFSIWGLQVATVTAHKGQIQVHDGS